MKYNRVSKIKRAALYGRVSHDEQRKFGYSIAAQLKRLHEFCDENHYLVVDEYIDEGISAFKENRPELQRMLNNLDDIDVVLFTKTDRFSRNILHANQFVERLSAHGVSIKAVDEDDIDTSTADGKFMFDLKVSLAEREVRKGSERIKDVFTFKVSKGHAITGNVPYGYSIYTDDNGAKLVGKDPYTHDIVEDIFEHFAMHHSIRKTMLYINDKYGIIHDYKKVLRVIKRKDYYTGTYRDNENYCPPYITLEQYYKNQDCIKRNVKTQPKHYHSYIFSGMVSCVCCGNMMSGNHSSKLLADQIRKDYYYYRCFTGIVNNQCKNTRRFNEEKLEAFILANIENEINDYVYKATVTAKKSKPKKKYNKKEILEEMDRLYYAYKNKRISQKIYDEEYNDLEAKLKLAELESPDEIMVDTETLEKFLNSDWRKVYETLDRENKRSLWRNLIKRVYYNYEDKSFSLEFY
jgi:DNA invertase Pin-like site-specific DNA recombinase